MKRKQRMHLLNQPYVKKILALFICFVLLSSSIPATAAEEPANNRTVKAGVFFFDGYHMQDSDGVYSGYGIELLNLISQYSHLNFEFTGYDNTWKETQSMLLNGEIDVATSARKTRERTEVFLFSLPIELNNTVLSVQVQNTSIISGDYSTYDGMTVGLLAGNSQNRFLPDFAEENGFTYQTREYEDSAQLTAALHDGVIDAILTSNLRRAENERLLDTIKVDYFYAITRKDDQALMNEINYAITQMNLYEGDWANVLYNKYYGTDVSIANGFTQRELDYIEAVASGEKQITVTAMPDRKPYSYAEDGELKGIQPQFFDSLMQIAGLPYEMIVPKDNTEYDQLKENGGVDVVIDWQQSASMEREYVDGGFLTNTYMNTGTTLLTRKDFRGPVSSLAVLDGLVGLPLEHERFENALIQVYSSPKDVMQAVLDGKTDAAFMRTHTAQFFVNNDRTNSLQFSMIDSEQIVFNMYIPSSSDHELITILNKCIQQVPDDVLSQLITEYTAGTPENVTFIQYMAVHPGMVLLLSVLVALAIGVILFLYLRSRWNNKLLRTTEQSKQELEEQLAIVNALTRDYVTVYTLNLRTGGIRALKMEGYLPSGPDWKSGEAFPYAKILHQYIEERVLEEDKNHLAEALSLERVKEALSTSPDYIGTYRIQTEKEIHNFQFVCVAYQTESQTNPLVLLGFRNIDEIVRKEQKQKEILEDALHMAQAASEAKTAFLSSVSHDIRTPMNAIIGFLTLMRNEIANPETVKEYIQHIDAASQHLLSLINDVLDMSKIESGSTTLSLTEMDLAEVIAEINSIILPQTKAKNQTFEIFVSHLNYEHLLGDKMRINQILINLLSNSVKYTPENGTIEMRVDELPQVVHDYSRIRFTVSDNGIGMSKDYLKVIFDPFTREDTKVTHEIQGTGLGMAITKNLVDLMGGSIKADSKLGEGSTFIVELELRIREQENDPIFWTDHHITRMIVVDDDEEVCRNVVKTMTGVGVSTDYATGGKYAVQIVHAAQEMGKPYDLILLDWKMPEPNGLETARLIRKDSKTPILLLTSYNWKEIEQEAMESGVNYFMPKPFFMSTFKEAVRLMMGRAKKAERQESDVVKGMHILVVDDIKANQLIMVKILSTLGAKCDTASNGQEAVEKFMNTSPGYNLILMDVQMPEMNGYEATKAIRASSHPFAKSVPIIAMTANAFVDDVRDAIESGMDAHIAKPIQIDTLKATIQQVLDSRNPCHEGQSKAVQQSSPQQPDIETGI
ncbi:MAG: response regulator [Lachnospiraceae bacterium]|nr:response regulator [Lachnospiraceae bacterium]